MLLHKKMNLVEQALDVKALEQAPIRNGYGEGLVEAGKKFPNVVALCADLTESTRTEDFRKAFPERFLQIGVAEQNLASVAAGMAAAGKIPYISSYAMFSPGRNWEQIRTTICYNEQHVIVAGAHAGVSVGPDGATHQAVEDMAIMRVIPNMTVLAPCDVHEARKATFAAASLPGPVYIRFAREKTPIFTTPETPFEIGKAEIFWEGKDPQVALIACGPLVHNALLAAGMLAEDGIDAIVVDNHTIKPMDEKTVIDVAKKAGALVTIEEHQINGGMGSAVAEIITRNVPVPIEFVGVLNRFGESGEPTELIEKLGMGPASIAEAAKKVIQRK